MTASEGRVLPNGREYRIARHKQDVSLTWRLSSDDLAEVLARYREEILAPIEAAASALPSEQAEVMLRAVAAARHRV